MPGHVDGFACFASFTVGSPSPMTYDEKDWAQIERAVTAALRRIKIPGHTVSEHRLILMTPTATAISQHTHRASDGHAEGPRRRRKR